MDFEDLNVLGLWFWLGFEHLLFCRVPFCGIVEALGGCWLISNFWVFLGLVMR